MTEDKNGKAFREKSSAKRKPAALYIKAECDFKDTIPMNESDAGSEFDTKKQIKYGTTYQAAWGIFSEYCDNSTIHGIKYLAEQKRPILERIFWICVFVLSIYTCSSLTMNIWDKWNNNPVIVSFAETSTPVWTIPFPSVTVCPETKSRQRVFNFTEMFWKIFSDDPVSNLTDQENYYMEAISQICYPGLLDDVHYGRKLANASDLINAMEETTPVFNETYFYCIWQNIGVGDCHNLHKVLTEEGLCYTFNGLDPNDVYRDETFAEYMSLGDSHNDFVEWNLEDGYDSDASLETYPHRVLTPGEGSGSLTLILKGTDQDNDHLCRGATQGFKILLHTPGEVPRMSQQFFPIPFGQRVLISIKPKIITTSNGLKDYDPMRRQCYFQTERYLRYFKTYNQNNCELECLSNFTLKECGCVKFSMPRTLDHPVCGAAKISCVKQAQGHLILKEFKQRLQTSAKNFRGATDCNCLPACTSIAYEAEISQTDYDYVAQFNAFKENSYMKDNPGTRLSQLSIFFKRAEFVTSKRSELYGTTDFLANCGGLLGLFMGVSTLSIVELVYFCTVRLLTNLRMRRKKRQELLCLQNANENGVETGMELAHKEA